MIGGSFSNRITSDELFKDLTADLVLSVTLEITHYCNFCCAHCYGGYERNKNDLSFEQIAGIIDQLHEHGTLDLSLTGGDPLTRPDFCDIYQYAREKGMFVSVLTNAAGLKPEHIISFLEYPVSHLSISVYGFSPETYDQVTRTSGNFQKVMRAISLLEEHNIPFELKSVATKANKREILALCRLAEELEVPFRYSTKLVPENNGCLDVLEHAITPEEAFWFEQNDEKRRQAWERGAANMDLYHEDRNCRKSCGFRYLCHAGDRDATISADGTLYLCLNERSRGYDLLSGTIQEGYEAFIKIMRDEKAPEGYKCLACPDIDYCDHCAAEIRLKEDFDFGNEPTCQLARLRHEWLGANSETQKKE